jgi:CheY-specific phosphatase CheX
MWLMRVSEQTLTDVAQHVLETMAFAFVVPGADDEVVPAPVLRVAVDFEGPFDGTLLLTVPEPVLAELIVNMLGQDDPAAEPYPHARQDALGELANVMCGNLVQKLAGPEPTFRLHPPHLVDEPPTGWPVDATTTVRVPLEEGYVELALHVVAVHETIAGAQASDP